MAHRTRVLLTRSFEVRANFFDEIGEEIPSHRHDEDHLTHVPVGRARIELREREDGPPMAVVVLPDPDTGMRFHEVPAGAWHRAIVDAPQTEIHCWFVRRPAPAAGPSC